MNISQHIPDGVPYIRSYTKQNIIDNIASNSCTGFIKDVTLDGGQYPYTISWLGPSGYTATTLNIYDLCGGVYSGTVTDVLFSAHTSCISIDTQPQPSLSASTIDSGCTQNINSFCKIKVHGFTHEQSQFTYILYEDGVPYDMYMGFTGEEKHTFSHLPPGNYTLTGYDGIEVDYQYFNADEKCADCYFLNSDVFGKTANVYSGLTPTSILNEWDKCIKFSDSAVSCPIGYGPNSYSGFGFTIYYDTGLQSNGTIDVNDPKAWFYTGLTSNRQTDTNDDWYLGAHHLSMKEGQDVGPAILPTLPDIGKFYYNTVINKFVINSRKNAISNTWVTYMPTVDYGINGNPVAIQLTGTSYYNTASALAGPIYDYSVSGSTNDVFAWDDASDEVFRLTSNANIPLKIISDCSYCNYVHEVTLGSASGDNDAIGVVLTSLRDELGLYGKVNHTHDLILFFANNNPVSSVNLRYNYGDKTQAFTLGDKIQDCGNPTSPCTATYSGYSSHVTIRPIANSPFATLGYSLQGTTRVRIERSGVVGEKFKIQMTDLMVAADVGTSNPYNPAYEINLNLLDKFSWTGETRGAPAYAKNLDLVKFLGAQRVGYLQSSQDLCRFFHISFSGTQCSTYSTEGGYGSSDTAFFPLYDPNYYGVSMSKSSGTNFRKWLGSVGQQVGKPTVPNPTPDIQASMETLIDPTVKVTEGGTPKDADVDSYVIYNPDTYSGYITLSFKWYVNVTNLLNGNVKGFYTIHGYDAVNSKFSDTPIISQLIDIPLIEGYSLEEDNSVNGEALSFTQTIRFPYSPDICQYLIKSNYLSKSKLEDINLGVGNPIASTQECPSAALKYTTWLDSSTVSVNNPDNVLGIYDKDSGDALFNFLPPSPNISLLNRDFEYPDSLACSSLSVEQVIVESLSGASSGSTYNNTPALQADMPYIVTIQTPVNGYVQVTLNGLTLWPGEELGDSDYYRDDVVFTFPPNVLQENDIIQFIYVSASYTQSYYINRIIVPSIVPVTTSDNYPISNEVYTDGLYYYMNLYPIPRGAIGVALNGVVLTQNGDFTVLGTYKIKLNNIMYPGGLKTDDLFTFFYFTNITLIGLATTKHPRINVEILNCSFNYKTTTILTIHDEDNYIVQQETKEVVLQINDEGELETGFNEDGQPVAGLGTVQYIVDVPTYGVYTYNIKAITAYKLLQKDEWIYNSHVSETYTFEIKQDTFYLTDDDET